MKNNMCKKMKNMFYRSQSQGMGIYLMENFYFCKSLLEFIFIIIICSMIVQYNIK